MSASFPFAHAAITARYLSCASPEKVFEWMAATTPKREGRSREQLFDRKLISQLLARRDPLVDLGIAAFSDDPDSLASLWKTGDRAIRVAIAGNTNRQGFAGLHDTNVEELCSQDDEIIKLIFSNPSMSHGGLANFIQRRETFKALSDPAWRKGLYFAIRNPILRKQIESYQFSDDGYEDYQQSRPFTAIWALLGTLEATDENAKLLSDAFLNVVVFDPPYEVKSESLGDALGTSSDSSLAESMTASLEQLAAFTKERDAGTRSFVEHMLWKWRDPPKQSDEEQSDGWDFPSDYGFIRQGIAAGAARQDSQRETVAFLRDHSDKWVRAGYYLGFPFRDADSVKAASSRDETFFGEQGVYNDALYMNTPAGRAFRGLDGIRSGSEWKQFSNDQMRRSVYYHRGLRLWRANPTRYAHPEDNVGSLSLAPSKREREEPLADYFDRRSEEMKPRTEARLEQIRRWLDAFPTEPSRTWPLLASMVADMQREFEERMTMLANENAAQKAGRSGFFGSR